MKVDKNVFFFDLTPNFGVDKIIKVKVFVFRVFLTIKISQTIFFQNSAQDLTHFQMIKILFKNSLLKGRTKSGKIKKKP